MGSMIHILFLKLNLRASLLKTRDQDAFHIYLKKKKTQNGSKKKKTQQGHKCPDTGQKRARKICLRKVREPYYLILKLYLTAIFPLI